MRRMRKRRVAIVCWDWMGPSIGSATFLYTIDGQSTPSLAPCRPVPIAHIQPGEMVLTIIVTEAACRPIRALAETGVGVTVKPGGGPVMAKAAAKCKVTYAGVLSTPRLRQRDPLRDAKSPQGKEAALELF